MKYDKNCEIELVASTNTDRQVFGVHFDAENKRLVATDGHAMAVIPCQVDEGDTSGRVPSEALKAARKVRGTDFGIELNGSAKIQDGRSWPRQEHLGYLPASAIDQVSTVEGEVVAKIRFDAEMLLRLARALGSNGNGVKSENHKVRHVTLEIRGELLPMKVFADGEPGKFGVLMPVRP
jgi:hypothetical protein